MEVEGGKGVEDDVEGDEVISGWLTGLWGILLVSMDIRGWILLGGCIGLVVGVWVFAWILGSLGWVKGTKEGVWELRGAGEGGERGGGEGYGGF
jgi:hypothetical protein